MAKEDENGKLHSEANGQFVSKSGAEEKKGYNSQDIVGNILRNASKAIDAYEKNREAGNGKDVKSKAFPEDKTTIKEQIVAGLDKIKNTKPVATINKAEITTDINKAINSLRDKLSQNGGIVVRNGFGDIQVGARLKDAVAYIKTPAEIAAFSSVPAVIQDGVLVGVHKNHKGRDYESYTIAGKVSIGGKDGIVAVVVKKTTGNFYKVHRVLTQDGKDLKIEKDTD